MNIGFKLTVTDSYSIFDERRIKGKYLISYSVRLRQIKVDPVYSSLPIGRWNWILYHNVWFTATKFQIHYLRFLLKKSFQSSNLGFRVCNNNKGFTWLFVAHVILSLVRIKSHWAFRKCQTSGLAWCFAETKKVWWNYFLLLGMGILLCLLTVIFAWLIKIPRNRATYFFV